jgi:hypothetical protein
MRPIFILSLVLLASAAASDALAGRIFGDIKLDGKPVPAGIPVMVASAPPAGDEAAKAAKPKPAPAMIDSSATDKFGSYKLNIKGEGKCILTLLYDKQAPALEVFSYKEATRYDVILEKKDGKYSLKRK